ncbi:alpha/beta hydrolase [Magnetospirillum sulfuroxidans]|nr:alpha/beta hydrolase [Magnetospirillum sulfuroxidans]
MAYQRLEGKTPGIVFLHGFHSDMEGTKALALESLCRNQGRAFLRFDLFGHGKSSGRVEDGSVSRWADDAVAALDELTQGPQVLVGSSLGGWIALLAALRRRDRVAALVGIAAAPDFTEDLMWAEFTPEQRHDLLAQGYVIQPNCYEPENPWTVPRLLIEDGRNNLLLRDTINLFCPVRLIQGQKDADVPWQTAVKIADCLASDDVEITLIKDGDHRLSRDRDLARMTRQVEILMAGLA